MQHTAHPRTPIHIALPRPRPPARRVPARAVARTRRERSLAAPLTLAFVVVGALLLAVAAAIAGAA